MTADNIIAHARTRFEHITARRVLKEKYQAKMLFAHAGGMFRAGPDLLTLLSTCPEEAVILDLYENPVKINSKEFFNLVQQRWQEQMTAWLVEYEELNKKR